MESIIRGTADYIGQKAEMYAIISNVAENYSFEVKRLLVMENNMTQVELKQAKDRFMELIELAASGEEVIIARDKEPLVRLTSIEKQKRPRQFGSAKGLIVMSDDFDEPLEEFKEYM